MLTLGNIIHHHGLNFHCYAGKTQLFSSQNNFLFPSNSISACINDINVRITSHFFLLVHKNVAHFYVDNVNIAGTLVQPSTTIKNLGIIFDSSFSFLPHISSLMKSAFFHLCIITCLRPFLNINYAA